MRECYKAAKSALNLSIYIKPFESNVVFDSKMVNSPIVMKYQNEIRKTIRKQVTSHYAIETADFMFEICDFFIHIHFPTQLIAS